MLSSLAHLDPKCPKMPTGIISARETGVFLPAVFDLTRMSGQVLLLSRT